jgi:group I intron endonuclease
MAAPAMYQNGKIYKLVNSNDPNEFYVGSTKNELRKRLHGHKEACKGGELSTVYQRMRELGPDDFHIVLLEAWPCNSKDELRQREDHWIVQLQPKLNMKRAFMTGAEKVEATHAANKAYREANPEYWSERAKSYHAANKDKIHARKSEKIKCDHCSDFISRACMARHRRLKHFDLA